MCVRVSVQGIENIEKFSPSGLTFINYLGYNLSSGVNGTSEMDRRAFLHILPKGVLIGVATGHVLKSYAEFTVYKALTKKHGRVKNPKDFLKEIYNEVIELGHRDNEDFIKREFLMSLDGNEENKEEHVVILIRKVGEKEKMIVQVTYFESRRKGSIIRLAKNTRKILCKKDENNMEIEESHYDEREIKSLLPEILQGIRYKKKLLKLLDRKI